MTITPFGRLEVQVHDLPTAKLQAHQASSRRTARDRFPDPEPEPTGKLPSDIDSGRGTEDATLDADAQGKPQESAHRTRGEPTHPQVSPRDEETTDGSEGALALQQPGELDAPQKIRERAEAQPRRGHEAGNPGQLPTAVHGAPQGQALPPQANDVPGIQPLAAATAAEAPATRSIETTQWQPHRLQAHKLRSTEAAQATRRQSPIQLAQEDRQSILESVTFALSEGKGEAVLHLNPKELGSLSIRLSMEGKQLRLRLSAERPEVAEALLEDAGKLREMLQQQGLNIQDFDVRTGQPGDHRQETYDFRRMHGISSRGRVTNGTADAESPPAPSRSRSVRIDGTGIDFIA